ncbi:MAG: GAF domain-containing protein [Sphingobacteriales bacterium]|nr:GAF domain-containing protein [Sphingobacteriales bacterium]
MLHRTAAILINIVVFLFPAQGQKQPVNDSLVIKKATAAFALSFKNADSAMIMASEALSEAVKTDNKSAIANAYNSIGWAYLHKGRLDSSIIFLQKSRAIFSSLESEYDITRVDINLAEVFTKQYKINEAIKYLIGADSLSRKIKSIPLQTDVKRQLAIVYRESGDKAKAAAYFKEALDGFARQGDYTRYVNTGISLSILYRNMNYPDSSLAILEKCLIIAKEKSGTPYQLAMIEEHSAESYLAKKQYNNALTHYTNAYNQFEKLNNRADIAYEAFCVGKTLSKLSRFKEAESYLTKAWMISDTLEMVNYQMDISYELAAMYEKAGNWKKAYQSLQQYAALKDTVNVAEQLEKTNALKEKYESEKKEQEIAFLKSENRLTKWWFISGILAAIILVFIAWINNYRRKIEKEKVLNYFATSLYNQNTVDDVFWDIAKNCISRLKFEDCVIYGYDENRNMLVQKAAFGPKNPKGYEISNLLEIPVGKGIVGAVAQSLKPEIIYDTKKDARYLVDDEARRSEITVPIISYGKLVGVIDSEHSRKGFFTKRHLEILQKISETCSKKITKYFVEESLRKQIARDLHDDLGSTLSTINIISKVLLDREGNDTLLKKQLAHIKGYSANMMENISDMVWAINPRNDSVESVLSRMKEWAAEICEPRQISLYFETASKIEQVELSTEKRKNVFLIFKEAVNNAAKYSNCKSLRVTFEQECNGNMSMKIKDDGEGFDVNNYKAGNGVRNMEARAKQIGAEFRLRSIRGEGTFVELNFAT